MQFSRCVYVCICVYVCGVCMNVCICKLNNFVEKKLKISCERVENRVAVPSSHYSRNVVMQGLAPTHIVKRGR